METISQAVGRLSEQGYTDQCRAEAGGVRFLEDGALYSPEDIVVEEVVRLEGTSSPDEESVVFAISSPAGGQRGTLCIAFGSGMDETDSEMVNRLTVRPH